MSRRRGTKNNTRYCPYCRRGALTMRRHGAVCRWCGWFRWVAGPHDTSQYKTGR